MKLTEKKSLIGIIMGSDSDWPVMKSAADICKQFCVSYDVNVVSAHRTPESMATYAKNAHTRGIKVVIAGAAGAAHLPGMVASYTPLPVIGVPVKSDALKGIDSLLSIVQMPGGVPVATVAINAAKNAGLLAIEILGSGDEKIMHKIIDYKKELAEESYKKDKNLTIN